MAVGGASPAQRSRPVGSGSRVDIDGFFLSDAARCAYAALMIKSASTPLRALLLILALVGLVLPWWYNVRYLSGGGSLAPGAFFGAAFANPLSTAITLDVYLAAVAFCIGVAKDADAGPRRWWAVPLTFGVGLSFALPLYLWWRSAPMRG